MKSPSSPWLGYGLALFAVALATSIRLALEPLLGAHIRFATLFFAVLVTAALSGLRPGLAAVGLGGVAGFFFLPPFWDRRPDEEQNPLGLLLYFVTALGITLVAEAMHARRRRAEDGIAARERAEVSLSSEIGLALTTSRTLRDALQGCAEAFVRQLDAAFVRIWTIDDSGEFLQLQASAGLYTNINGDHARIRIGDFKIGRIAASRTPHLSNDVLHDANVDAAWARREGLESFAGYPLLVGERLVGVMGTFCRRPLSPTTLDALASVAYPIALGIERGRAEAELRDSELRFRQLAENIREVFWLTDPVQKKALYVSNAFEEIWGLPCEALYAKPSAWLDAIHADDRGRVAAAFAKLSGEGAFEEEYRIVRPDGTQRWIHDRGFPIRDEAQRFYRIAGVAEDISDRKLAETTLRQQQQRLEGIVNSAMDGIITIDEDQRVVVLNAAAERMFGWKASELLGHTLERLIPERFRAAHGEHVRDFGRTGVTARAMGRFGPISGLRADGEEFPIEASISQLSVDGRKLFTVTCRDVTDRVRAAAAQSTLEAQLRQSQKMEAFGQLAGGVAHDFNNLLTVICGYSEMLQMRHSANDPDRQMIGEIHDAGQRAVSLTRQLLAFSRQQVLEPRVLDLNVVIGETEKMLRRLIGEDVQLSTHLRPRLPLVRVDPGQIDQVIINLAVNARDAMPQGGKLTIETGEAELDEAYAKTHPETKPGRHVLMAMTDTGIGMSAETKGRLFEPFFTTKGVGHGTGLGLAVVHGIVKQSGGSIEVYSELGVGTSFKIYLPAVVEPQVKSELRPTAPPRGHETILLVEDEPGVREFAASALEAYGYTVFAASGGNAALRLLAELSKPVSLLVTDVVMPEMSGPQLAEILRGRDPKLKVLFLSGYTDDAVVRHGVLQAEVAFLQKPFTPSSLARKVREVLEKA